MRRLVIGSSWKMNKTRPEAREFVRVLRRELPAYDTARVQAYILPAFTALEAVGEELAGYPTPEAGGMELGAQNMFWEDAGAYTGEISPVMLKELGCSIVMLGHSERRALWGETDEMLNRKVRAALRHGLTPLLCIGETAAERDAGQTTEVLRQQLSMTLRGVPAESLSDLLLLYEPRWAIGQKEAAPPAYVQAAHAQVRALLSELYAPAAARAARVIYGGSVNLENLEDLLNLPDVDGAAVSRAAWDPVSFARMVQRTEEVARAKARRPLSSGTSRVVKQEEPSE